MTEDEDLPADESYDASDLDQVNKRKRDRGREDKDDDEELSKLLSTRRGRAFMWRLLATCHIYEANTGPVEVVYFREGERNIGLRLFDHIGRVASVEYGVMLKEHADGYY